MIKKYLDDLEARIDQETEDTLIDEWTVFVERRFNGDIFSPKRLRQSLPEFDWPSISVNESFESYEKMALQQFAACSGQLARADAGPLMNVRSNYGTGIMSSLFGCELYMMDDEHNTLPTTLPLPGGADAIRKLLDKGMPDLSSGLSGKALEMGEYFVEIMKDYPQISQYVYLYHPDLQSPMDVCELIWGSDMFLDLIDQPELAKDFLTLIADAYIAFMKRWLGISPFRDEFSPHWSLMFKGHVMLRDDSAMNLSPDMFREFVRPYDQRILDVFGGGGVHFCGRGDHYIDQLAEMSGVSAVAMSQPEYNDMEKIYQSTVDKDIQLIGFSREAADAALANGRSLNGNVHCG